MASSSAGREMGGRTRTTCGLSSFGRASPWKMRSSKASMVGPRRMPHVHVFASTVEAQRVLDAWRDDYNYVRPHSSLQDRTPAAVSALWATHVCHVSRLHFGKTESKPRSQVAS